MEFSWIAEVEALEDWRVQIKCADGCVWECDLSDLVGRHDLWRVLADGDAFHQVEVTDAGIAIGWPSVRKHIDIPVWILTARGERIA